MTEPNVPEDSYPYDTSETGPSFPYRMSMQESRTRVDALEAGVNRLLYGDTAETDRARLAIQREFVQTVGTYSTLLVGNLIGYDDVVIPSNRNVSLRVRILQDLYKEVSNLMMQPALVDTRRSLSRHELATAIRGCYEALPDIYQADAGIQQRAAKATLNLWGDIVQANPDGILLGAQEDGWMQEMEAVRRLAFEPDQAG